jgi:hypothetical protein
MFIAHERGVAPHQAAPAAASAGSVASSWEDGRATVNEVVPFDLVQHEGGHICSRHGREPTRRLDVLASSILSACGTSGQLGCANNRPGKPARMYLRFVRGMIRNRPAKDDLHCLLERESQLMAPAWHSKKGLIDEARARVLAEGGEDATNALCKGWIAADRGRRPEAADHSPLVDEGTLDGGRILDVATNYAQLRVVERERGGLAHKGTHDVVPGESLLHDQLTCFAGCAKHKEVHDLPARREEAT